MALGTTSSAMERSGSVESKPGRMACNISGLTAVASTNQAALSFKRLSIPCFDGTEMQLDATSIFPMFRQINIPDHLSFYVNQLSTGAGGSPEDGHCKSSLLRHQLSSSLEKAS